MVNQKHLFVLAAAVALAAPAWVFAAGTEEERAYPSRDIEVIINAGAGGGTDTIMRKIVSLIEGELPVSMFTVNKPGAASATGPNDVMNSEADGYTLGNLNYGSVINAVWEELIPGYDLAKLNFVALITQEDDAIMVGPDAPFQTFEAFIEAARQSPGEIRVADQGIGSRVYLHMLRIEELFGVEFNKISYAQGGSAAQREALVNGEVDAAITSLGDFAPLLNSGDAVGIVEFSSQPNPAYDVPTIIELGYDDLLSGSFITLAVPADTPPDRVEVLEAAIYRAHQSSDFQSWLAGIGVAGPWLGDDEVEEFIEDVQAREFAFLDQLREQGILE